MKDSKRLVNQHNNFKNPNLILHTMQDQNTEELLSINSSPKEQEDLAKKAMIKQGYDFVGNHAAAKVCTWTKRGLSGKGVCYKQTFYGIRSHRCVQMTPTQTCNHACTFCWRDLNSHTSISMGEDIDDPKQIVEGCIKSQNQKLIGFKGNHDINQELYKESNKPLHFAISLNGEPAIYPKLGELIQELKSKNISSYVVTNGTFPERLEELYNKDQLPTQLYISVDAPNEELYNKIDQPLTPEFWNKFVQSLKLLPELKKKTRTTLRFTLIKNHNMCNPEQWAEIIKISQPLFVEVKGYMWIGYSRERHERQDMPSHEEVRAFTGKICKHSGYKYIDEQEVSNVVLIMKEDFEGRIMRFEESVNNL